MHVRYACLYVVCVQLCMYACMLCMYECYARALRISVLPVCVGCMLRMRVRAYVIIGYVMYVCDVLYARFACMLCLCLRR